MCRLFKNMENEPLLISDILNNGLFNSNKAKIALKCVTIFSFWGQIAGKKFEQSSKPYAIKGMKLYVSCENPYVMQELIMYKKILLQKLIPYTRPLEIVINDIVFDYKSWNEHKKVPLPDDFPDFYTDERLLNIDICEDDFKNVFINIDNSEYLNDEQKRKFKERIIKLQKAKRLRLM